MDDDATQDEKHRLGLTAMVLRCSKDLLQSEVAERLGVSPKRVSEIETGEANPERLEDFAKRIGFRPVHVFKTRHLLDFLGEEGSRPFDPLGPTPEQEVTIYEAGREVATRCERELRDDCRRLNLEKARQTAAEQWEQLQQIDPPRRQAEIRRNPDYRTWAFCELLCAESVRQAVRKPTTAIHVARLAVAAARCDLPWVGRLVAHALAHLANAYRVKGTHEKAERLFSLAHWLWDSSVADPGLFDPGRLLDLEASLRKDQRRLPEALDLLQRAFPISRVPGRILISRALVLSLMGSYEEAITTLRRAEEFFVNLESRDEFLLSLNMGINLCHLRRFNEAAVFAKVAFEITEASGNRIDQLRTSWLQARVLAGQEDHFVALGIFRILHREFDELKMTYDLALVSLELAALLLSLGRTKDCRTFVAGLPSYFAGKGIHKEALAAIDLFSKSVCLDTATVAFAHKVAAFLYLAQGNQELRFNHEPG